MARTRPTTHIDEIGNLNLSPENAFGNYLESKQQEAFFIKPPNCDSAGDTVELFSIRCHWEVEAMRELQAEMLAHMKRQTRNNASRIGRLNKIQLNLRKKLIDFSSFIKDCDDKRAIAEKKVAEEVEMQIKLKTDSEQYMKSLEVLGEFREKLQSTVKDFEPYERVMEEVVEKSEIFVSVKDCMDRCDALMLAQVEIAELEEQKVDEIENMHRHMKEVINDAAADIMGLQNDLAEMDRLYTRLNTTCSKWETKLANAKDMVAMNDMQKAQTMDGIRFMYVLLCRHRNMNPVFQRNEVEAQLDFIMNEIELLRKVYEICNAGTNVDQEEEEEDQNMSEIPC